MNHNEENANINHSKIATKTPKDVTLSKELQRVAEYQDKKSVLTFQLLFQIVPPNKLLGF